MNDAFSETKIGKINSALKTQLEKTCLCELQCLDKANALLAQNFVRVTRLTIAAVNFPDPGCLS